MDSSALVFLIIAVAILAILFFMFPRKKAEPPKAAPKIEAPTQPVTPPATPKVAEPEPVVAQPAPLMDSAAAKPKAKAPAAKTPAKAKAAPVKAKAAPAPKAEPKAKAAAPVKAKDAPKAKAAAPAKAKAAPAPAPKKVAAKKDVAPKAKAEAKAAPKPKAAAPKAASKPAIPDNIELLKGVGPKLVAQLKSLGITSLDQIANWTSADIADIDPKLGVFTGRIGRDNWVDQAKLLVAGDVAGFEKKYGALGSEITKG